MGKKIRRPYHFLRTEDGSRYKCMLCSTSWLHASAAAAHEDTGRHTALVRLQLEEDSEVEDVPRASSPLSVPLASDDPNISFVLPRGCSPLPTEELDPDHGTHPSPELRQLRTYAGPALPEDDEDYIYDDWGGVMGTMMEKRPEEEEDAEDAEAWDCPAAGIGFEGGGDPEGIGMVNVEVEVEEPPSDILQPTSDDAVPDGICVGGQKSYAPWPSKEVSAAM
ncbi:hypothetical protein OH76DRAFT_1206036 [Lentinus brumalis]|uniref:C2H2-type domain-containing protein n=1 Tax=Lentinus brumalis TaxID=2498619 RepID=A0A371CST2_9APHY|nr:hypothetical protein OH76DRAFT_1206036 [Polyporus brumalis]